MLATKSSDDKLNSQRKTQQTLKQIHAQVKNDESVKSVIYTSNSSKLDDNKISQQMPISSKVAPLVATVPQREVSQLPALYYYNLIICSANSSCH